MNEKEQAVLDAAREYARNHRSAAQRLADVGGGVFVDDERPLTRAALAAYPADAPPAPEVVRSVDDLRNRDTVWMGGLEWHVAGSGPDAYLARSAGSAVSSHDLGVAVAAGTVTRTPAPEPDPLEVERLGCYLQRHGVHVEAGVVKDLLRAGLLYPAEEQP